MDWNSFEFAYRLEDQHQRLLITIEAYREAASNLLLPSDWREQLDRLNRVRAVYGTTALEGNPLSEDQVAESLRNEESPSRSTREQIQIRNAATAQDWVKARFGTDKEPLTLQDILAMLRLIAVNDGTLIE